MSAKCKQRRPIASPQPYLPYCDYPGLYSSVLLAELKSGSFVKRVACLDIPMVVVALKLAVVMERRFS